MRCFVQAGSEYMQSSAGKLFCSLDGKKTNMFLFPVKLKPHLDGFSSSLFKKVLRGNSVSGCPILVNTHTNTHSCSVLRAVSVSKYETV